MFLEFFAVACVMLVTNSLRTELQIKIIDYVKKQQEEDMRAKASMKGSSKHLQTPKHMGSG